MDVEGSLASLAQYMSDQTPEQRAVRSGTVRSEVKTPLMRSGHNAPIGVHIVSTSTRVQYGIRYKVADTLKVFLAQTGFTNPLNLGWEILPFSFVVDWFLPVGNYLETLSAWDGLTFSGGWKTTFTREEATAIYFFSGVLDAHQGPEFPATTDIRGSYWRYGINLDRAVLTAFPSGSPPSFKANMDVTKSLNALALVQQLFGRR
jgi:hypothetical protein